MARFIRRKRRAPSALHDIPLTPLIDTALTLLVIFMITTPMLQNAIKVTLPTGQTKEDSGVKQELVVYIDKDQKLYFNGTPVTKENLVAVVKKKIGNDTQSTVFVKADRDVQYGYVIEIVVEPIRAGGVKNVALATKVKTT